MSAQRTISMNDRDGPPLQSQQRGSRALKARSSPGAGLVPAADLAAQGYARVAPSFLLSANENDDQTFREFLLACRDLPADPHCVAGLRFRRYGRFKLQPDTLEITAEAPTIDLRTGRAATCYVQSAANNPEHAGRERHFAALLAAQSDSQFLRTSIARCFRDSPWPLDAMPVVVGVHIVRTIARPGEPGVSTPNHLHHDGEPVTWAFLLSRSGVAGGENVIASPSAAGHTPAEAKSIDILARFTLEQPLSGWVVDDRRVSHYASPIEPVPGVTQGQRTILLIDFSPDSNEAR